MTTSVTSNVLSDLSSLGQALKVDLLQTLGTPVLTLLQSLQTIAQAPFTPQSGVQAGAAWATFVGNALLALPNLEAEAAQALLQFLISKLQANIPGAAVAVGLAK